MASTRQSRGIVFVKHNAPYFAGLKPYILPLTLKDDLDISPLKMCISMRYACMPNIELLSLILQNSTLYLEG